MAKRKEDPPKAGCPGWMATFGDLMNLLLCFFVLLFSMSSISEQKFVQVIASLQNSAPSILNNSGKAVGQGDGVMVASGISQLQNIKIYYKENNTENDDPSGNGKEEDLKEQLEQAALKESEQMGEDIEKELSQLGIGDKVQMDITAQYVKLTLNGSLLFDTGQAEIKEDVLPLMGKLTSIIENYGDNTITIEGHTDNVPISNGKFQDNSVLSYYRAYEVKMYLLNHTTLKAANIASSARGDEVPVADNGTEAGRARNRRVEIMINNSYNSY
jgi:chemotaxis protein MotB